MTANNKDITNQNTNDDDDDAIEKVRQQWNVAQSIQNIKIN